MKKSILSVAVLAASLFSFNAFAQTPSKTVESCAKTEQCASKACPDGAKACKPQRPCAADPFAGITLTQDQQTKLTALKEQRKAKSAVAAKARKERVQQRDSVARSGKKEYLESVKEILTPDQYVVFLENVVLSNPAPGHDKAMSHHKMHAMKKGDRKIDMRHAEKSGDKK